MSFILTESSKFVCSIYYAQFRFIHTDFFINFGFINWPSMSFSSKVGLFGVAWFIRMNLLLPSYFHFNPESLHIIKVKHYHSSRLLVAIWFKVLQSITQCECLVIQDEMSDIIGMNRLNRLKYGFYRLHSCTVAHSELKFIV